MTIETRFYDIHAPVDLAHLCAAIGIFAPEGSAGDVEISIVAPVSDAHSGAITYIDNKKALRALDGTNAAACLCPPKLESDVAAMGVLALPCAYPRAAFAEAIQQFVSKRPVCGSLSIDKSAQIAKSASLAPHVVIGEGASIGENVSIGPFTVIGAGCRIGDGADIRSNVSLSFCDIGEGAVIHDGARIGGDGFGVAPTDNGTVAIPHLGMVSIGANASIGCNTTIDRALFGITEIGAGTHIDNLCMIAHNVKIGRNCMFAALVGIPGSVTIGDGVILAGQVGIADHVTIHDGAVVTGHSGVMHDIPAGETWGGYPAQPIRGHLREVAVLRRLAKSKGATRD